MVNVDLPFCSAGMKGDIILSLNLSYYNSLSSNNATSQFTGRYFSSSSFEIRVNLLHPQPSLFPYGLLLSLWWFYLIEGKVLFLVLLFNIITVENDGWKGKYLDYSVFLLVHFNIFYPFRLQKFYQYLFLKLCLIKSFCKWCTWIFLYFHVDAIAARWYGWTLLFWTRT